MLSKTIRFFYAAGPHSTVIHRAVDGPKVEGSLTLCGRPMRVGWKWWIKAKTSPRNLPICARCS